MAKRSQQPAKLGIFSFFAGVGMLDLGFEREGFTVLFANEIHKPFLDAYRHVRTRLSISPPEFGHHQCDVGDFLSGAGKRDLVRAMAHARNGYDAVGFIGGPPCPDFSVGGKNRGCEGENGRLSGTYVELIVRNKPDFFLFENVKGLWRTRRHRTFYDSLKARLMHAGYSLGDRLINALEYGAPQDRERIILIGIRKELLRKLYPNHASMSNLDERVLRWEPATKYDRKQVSSFQWPQTDTFAVDAPRVCPTALPQDLTVEYWFKRNAVETHPNSQHAFSPRAGLARFMTVAEGDDSRKSFKRLHRWRYSPTAAYGNNEVHLHPYKARRITVAEALAIQSLPPEFVIPADISLTDMFKMVGNGVPYLAGRGLAQTIAATLAPIDLVENTANANRKNKSTKSRHCNSAAA